MTTDVTLLGTGLLGSAVVRRLLATGSSVTVWNRTPGRAAPLERDGARRAGSAAAAIDASPVTLLFLTDAAALRAVLFPDGTRPVLRGRTIVQQGTIAPGESRELAEAVHAAGGAYVEAPVLGSLPQALSGTLAVLVGGTPEPPVRTLLETLGKLTFAGEVGKAAALKLALNQLIASLTAAFSTSLAYVRAEGLPVETFMEVLRPSALYASTFDKKLPRMLGEPADPNFPARHMLKDVELFVEAARRDGVDVTLAEAAARLARKTVQIGLGAEDYSAVYQAIEKE